MCRFWLYASFSLALPVQKLMQWTLVAPAQKVGVAHSA